MDRFIQTNIPLSLSIVSDNAKIHTSQVDLSPRVSPVSPYSTSRTSSIVSTLPSRWDASAESPIIITRKKRSKGRIKTTSHKKSLRWCDSLEAAHKNTTRSLLDSNSMTTRQMLSPSSSSCTQPPPHFIDVSPLRMPQRSVSHESSSASALSSSPTTTVSHSGQEGDEEEGERIKIVDAAIDMIQEYNDLVIGNRRGNDEKGHSDQALDVATTPTIDAK